MQRLEEQMDVHWMDKQLKELERNIKSYPGTEDQQEDSGRLDVQIIEVQHTAEAKRRQIQDNDLPYSIPVCYWTMLWRSYNDLKRCHEGGVQQVANVMNRAKAN